MRLYKLNATPDQYVNLDQIVLMLSRLTTPCHSTSACLGGNACPHRRCVNPAHLELVDNRENVIRGNAARKRARLCESD